MLFSVCALLPLQPLPPTALQLKDLPPKIYLQSLGVCQCLFFRAVSFSAPTIVIVNANAFLTHLARHWEPQPGCKKHLIPMLCIR